MPEPDRLEAPELHEIVSRLAEVRRRFVRDAGDGDRFELAEARLDGIILDLRNWLKPGGHSAALDDLELRLGALEEMLEGLGFAGYAHVVGSVRERLAGLGRRAAEADTAEPPPARRFEPPRRATASRPPRRGRRAAQASASAAPRRGLTRFLGWVSLVVVLGCVAAALALGVVPLARWLPAGAADDAVPVAGEREPAAIPDEHETSALEPLPEDRRARSAARSLGEVVHELDAAEAALGEQSLDDALRHFAAAAALDRHHRGVVSLADSLIAALLRDADRAFDAAEWELAAKRIDDARHLARGLYLDQTAIEHAARRHQLMTRFADRPAADVAAIRGAVGRAVRVTLTTRDRLLGRLEAVRDDRLVLAIRSGLEGGGVSFSKEIPLSEVVEVRVYDAEHPSQVVLDPRSTSP